jgi:hypothetical protein
VSPPTVRARTVHGRAREFTDCREVVVSNRGNGKSAELCGQYLAKGGGKPTRYETETRNAADRR